MRGALGVSAAILARWLVHRNARAGAQSMMRSVLRSALRWTSEDATTNPMPCECHGTFGRGAATREARGYVMQSQFWIASSKVHREVKRSMEGKWGR
ncbi:unnamed protein product [Ixodes pacificus]